MKFFFDYEFLENGVTIVPISLGMVREDGETYYAEYRLTLGDMLNVARNEWLMANVVPGLNVNNPLRFPPELLRPAMVGAIKPVEQIADEVRDFTKCKGEPEFWANCGAYDWVALNQMYGPMIAHPKPWPYYCNDIQQLAVSRGINRRKLPKQETEEHNALNDAWWDFDTYYWIMSQPATVPVIEGR